MWLGGDWAKWRVGDAVGLIWADERWVNDV